MTIPNFKKGDRVSLMATTWALKLGLENEKGTVLDINGGSCIVLLDREWLYHYADIPIDQLVKIRTCRVCGCTDNDCSQCIEKTGQPCHWVEEDLCSACAGAE